MGAGERGGAWRPKSLRTSGLRSNIQVEATFRVDMTQTRFDEIHDLEVVLF